jgi:hypothetical protein
LKYLIDIDKTICFTEGEDYENAQPYPERIQKINELHEQGHRIIYWTARGAETGINYDDLTRTQLKKWGCKYHSLGNKPFANFIVDDLAVNSNDFFKNE